jgi:hypothetical protein
MYPNGESNTNKVLYMNMAQDALAPYFGLEVVDESLTTLADDDEYDLPTGIEDVSMIDYMEIANEAPDTDRIVESTNMIVGSYTIANQPAVPSRISVTQTAVSTADTSGTVTITGTVGGTAGTTESITPVAGTTVYGTKYFSAITTVVGAGWVIGATNDTITVGVSTGRYDYTRYYPSFKNYKTDKLTNSFTQEYTSAGTKSLILYPAPSFDGGVIRIRYRKKLTELSATSLSSSPDFESTYHDLLALYACYMLCSTGANPDTIQSDRFMQSYDEGLNTIWKKNMEQDARHPKQSRDNKQWRR